MKNVAIIIIFKKWLPYYSLTSVVKSQIRSLVKNGYSPRVLMVRGCPNWLFGNKVDYRGCIPDFIYDEHHDKANPSFYKKVCKVTKALKNNLKGIDIVLTHDIVYLPMYLIYNVAVRKVAKELGNMRWLHWSHSMPRKSRKKLSYPLKLLFEGMPNSKFVCGIKAHKKGFAHMFGVPLRKVVTVYNPRFTLNFMEMHNLSYKIIEQGDVLQADIVSVMPSPLSRLAKQLEICIYIMAALKEQGKKVTLIFANAYHRGMKKVEEEQIHVIRLRWLANKLGLSDKNVIFTSEIDKKLRDYCPEAVVKSLFQISNIFIHPSVAETCSMTLLEAATAKNLCVLNKDVASFKELAETNAVWIKCGDLYSYGKSRVNFQLSAKRLYNHYISKKARYKRYAQRIIKAMDKNKPLSLFTKTKKEFNEQNIFETQLKPLIESSD